VRCKKITCLFLILSFLELCGCMWDPYSGKRPFDYGEARWISEEGDMYFNVEDEYTNPLTGKIEISGKLYVCEYWFIHQTNQLSIDVFETEEDASDRNIMVELWGDCTFSNRQVILKVDPKRDAIFHGTRSEIVFIRHEMTGS